MATTITQLAQFVTGIIILIILHELGHFVAARLLKIEVDEFGLGFPPRAAKLFRVWGTDFTLNWIPLGGFVRPKGENDPDIAGGLAAASPWKRLIVLVAGPMTNIFIGLVLGAMLFYQVGRPITDKVLVREVVAGSPAEQAGLQTDDLILEVGGVRIDGQERLQELIGSNLGKATVIIYERAGEIYTASLVPRLNPPEGEGAIGIVMSFPTEPISVSQAIQQGASATYDNVSGILHLPFRILSGAAAPEERRAVGYKGMFDIYRALQSPLLFFMAISISLGVINLLPIPALDGGRILLILPELLLRKRVPPQLENTIHLVGFAVLLVLLIYINIQDFVNPIQLP